MAFPSGWGRKHAITIDNTKVSGSGSHTNFPVAIGLDHLNTEVVDAGSNSAQNGGADIRFTSDAEGTTQLPLHVVSFVTDATAGNRKCLIFVLVPSLSTSADTTIYVWYNNSSASAYAVTDTYGRNAVWAQYEAVIIGNEASGTLVDSTGNGYDATLTSGTQTATSTNHPLAGMTWIDFDGSSYYTLASSSGMLDGSANMFLSAWHVNDNNFRFRGLIGNRNNSPSDTNWFQTFTRPQSGAKKTGTEDYIEATSIYSTGVLHFSAFQHTGSELNIYTDGVLNGQDTTISVTSGITGVADYRLGTYYSASSKMDGRAGLWKAGLGTYSADWLLTEYNNISSMSTFASAGTSTTALPEWKFSVPIDSTNIDSTLTDFPVVIHLEDVPTSFIDAGTESVESGGGSIIAGNEDFSVRYPVEIVRCVPHATAGSRELEIHVKVPSVSSSADTDVWIGYKLSGATQPAASDTYGSESVWDSNFTVVSHDGGATNSVDSSSGTEVGSMTTGSGPEQGQVVADFGTHSQNNAWRYTGLTAPTTALTSEAFVNFDDVETNDNFCVAFHNAGITQAEVLYTYDNTGSPAIWTNNNPFNPEFLNGGAPVTATWMYASATKTGSTDRKIYEDGTQVANDNPTNGIPSSMTSVTIGWSGDSTNNMNGLIGEVRTSIIERSAAWQKATATMFVDHSNFFGSPTTPTRISGGTTVEESISLSLSSGITPANVATMGESIALNLSKGFSESNTTIQNDSITISGVFDASHSGGVLLEDSISLGATLGATGSGVIVIEDSISMGLSAGAGSGNIATIEDSIILDLSSSVSLSNIISAFNDVSVDFVADVSASAGFELQDSISLAVQSGYSNAATLTADETISLSVANGITSQSIANLVSAIALGVSAGVYAQDDSPQNITEAISLGLSLANTFTTTMDAEGSISVGLTGSVQSSGVIVTADGLALNLSLGYSTTNTVDAIANITLGLESSLIASGILTIQEAINLGFDAGTAIASSLSALTPNERRTFTVSARNKTLTVAISSRRKDA